MNILIHPDHRDCSTIIVYSHNSSAPGNFQAVSRMESIKELFVFSKTFSMVVVLSGLNFYLLWGLGPL